MFATTVKACGRQSPYLRPAGVHSSVMASTSSSSLFAGPDSEAYRKQSCKALGRCSKQTPQLTGPELEHALKALPAWQLDSSSSSLTRQFPAKNFIAAVKFFNEVADLAEEEGHHPDLHLTEYREVKVEVSTHAIGGLSLFDIVLATKIDALPVEYSPKWLRQQYQ